MKTVFEQDMRNDLRLSEQTLDKELVDQLTDIRQQAICATPPPRRLRRFLWPTAGMTLASILVLASATLISPLGTVQHNESLSDYIERYVYFDFYYWLAENEQDLRG